MDLMMSHKRQNSTFLFTVLLFSDTKTLDLRLWCLSTYAPKLTYMLILALCMKLALSCENKIISQQNNDQNQFALVVCKF